MGRATLNRLWALVWRRWLIDGRGEPMQVVKVKGWRTALVDSRTGSRRQITPCFTLFGIHFD